MSRLSQSLAVFATAGIAATAAYALGSQNDGTADAKTSDPIAHSRVTGDVTVSVRGPGPGLADLASDLGVTEERLHEAFEALRPDDGPQIEERHVSLAAELADALGVDEAKIEAALEDVLPKPGEGFLPKPPSPDDLAAELADALGIDEAKVQDAFDTLHGKQKAEHQAREAEFAKQLAAELGISVDKVKAALEANRGPFGRGGVDCVAHPAGPDAPEFD